MITITQKPYLGPDLDRSDHLWLSRWSLADYFAHCVYSIGVFFLGFFVLVLPAREVLWILGAKPETFDMRVMASGCLGGLVASIRYLPNLWFDSSLNSHLDLLAQDYQAKVLNSVCITGICGVWSIDEIEDFGPGYVVETLEGEYAIVMAQMLDDFQNDDGQPVKHEAANWAGHAGCSNERGIRLVRF